MTPGLTFDEASHGYALNGVAVPSVTTLLDAAGLVDLHGSAESLAFWRDRGTAVHTAVELDSADNLDESTVVEDVRPYLEAWRKFRREAGYVPEHVELRLAHPTLRYAGTIDAIGTMRAHRAIIDVKSGSPRRATGVQLAGYAALAAANKLCRPDIRRYALHLSGEGTYQLVPYTSTRDLLCFMAALQIHSWRTAA